MYRDIPYANIMLTIFWVVPVPVDKAGVDVVGAFEASDWLQTHASGLIGHDVHQPVLELVAGQVGRHKPGGVSFTVRQTLQTTQRRNALWVNRFIRLSVSVYLYGMKWNPETNVEKKFDSFLLLLKKGTSSFDQQMVPDISISLYRSGNT